MAVFSKAPLLLLAVRIIQLQACKLHIRRISANAKYQLGYAQCGCVAMQIDKTALIFITVYTP